MMGIQEPMESTPSLWHNRRVQRSAGFVFLVITILVLSLYTRNEWPTIEQLHLEKPASLPPQTLSEDPLYNTDKPEYDPEHMPEIPELGKTTTDSSSPSPSPGTAFDPTRVAVIIETRPRPILPAVLSQFIYNLPPAWIVRLIGSPLTFSLVKQSSSLSRHIKSKKLVLTQLPHYYEVDDNEKLSVTLTNITFWNDFLAPAEWVLMFQTDSIICSASDQSIDDWVDKGYDWVGAPWNEVAYGGNGGLSLRHVPALVKVLEKETRMKGITLWEDIWFSQYLTNLPHPNIAQTFSVESVYYERPFGYHLRGSGRYFDEGIWANRVRQQQIFDYCPETKIIFDNLIVGPPLAEPKILTPEELMENEKLGASATETSGSQALATGTRQSSATASGPYSGSMLPSGNAFPATNAILSTSKLW